MKATTKTPLFKNVGIDDYGIPNLVEEVLSANMPQKEMKDFDVVAEEIREKYFDRV